MPIEINFIETIDCTIDYDIRDGHGVLQRFSVAPEDILLLCGGVPSRDITFLHVVITSSTENTLTASVNTDIYQVFRTINFGSRRISNDKMLVYDKDHHIGTSLFLNQVYFARQLGFIKLSTTALEWDGQERWDGYYRWARLGYQMTDRNDLEDFADLMRYFPRPVTNVGELVLSEDGYAFWKNHGFTWTGEFLLADDSPGMNHLQYYLALKKIDFIL